MHHSKLIDLLKTIPAASLKELKLFVQSPYFRRYVRAKPVEALYLLLYKHAPKFKHKSLEKTAAYSEIYVEQPYDEAKMDRTMSELTQLIRKFIVLEQSDIDEESVEYQLKLAAWYRTHNFIPKFEQTTKQIRDMLALETTRHTQWHHDMYRLESEVKEHETLYHRRLGDANLIATIRHFDLYFLINRLELMLGLLSYSKFSKLAMDEAMAMHQALEPIYASMSIYDDPIKQIYYKTMLIMTDNDNSQRHEFDALLELVREYEHLIPEENLKSLSIIYRNYCTRFANLGIAGFHERLLQLYKEDLAAGLLYIQGGLTTGALHNLVNTGLKLNDFDWVKQVLDDHANRIVGSKFPKDIYHYNLAVYYFYRKDYDQAMNLLAKSYEDVQYGLKARVLEIKLLYEAQSWSVVVSKCDALKVQLNRLKRKDIAEQVKNTYSLFPVLVHRIVNAKAGQDQALLDEIVQDIQAASPMTIEYQWLQEKCRLPPV